MQIQTPKETNHEIKTKRNTFSRVSRVKSTNEIGILQFSLSLNLLTAFYVSILLSRNLIKLFAISEIERQNEAVISFAVDYPIGNTSDTHL